MCEIPLAPPPLSAKPIFGRLLVFDICALTYGLANIKKQKIKAEKMRMCVIKIELQFFYLLVISQIQIYVLKLKNTFVEL